MNASRSQGAAAGRETTAPGAEVPAVELIGVSKRFDEVLAVDDVSLRIRQNEFFSILGPSGCGKTTIMRMIAGFEVPSVGEVRLMNEDQGGKPPNLRNLNMVFQNYAIFPHLDVHENVAFELKVRRWPKADIEPRVTEALRLVRLTGFERRKPSQLSGGQRQRVALARALVGRPAVLLLDEPLGALDQKLRKEMQIELKRLQREVGITFVYVTHDQEEALTMSDRIAVMNAGRVLQADTPRALYELPATRFVADFIGASNLVEGHLAASDHDLAEVEIDGVGTVRCAPNPEAQVGDEVTIAIRPERLRLARGPAANGENHLRGTVRDVVFVGNDTQYFVTLGNGQDITVREQNAAPSLTDDVRPGQPVDVAWAVASTRLLTD